MVIDEPIQIEILEPLLVENEYSKHVEFEPVNNYLTHGSIIRADVLVHYLDDVHVQFNVVPIRNDQNNVFVEEPINVYTLEFYNLKRHVYSQP